MREDNKNGFFDFDMDTNIIDKLENEKEIFDKKFSKDEKKLLMKNLKKKIKILKISLKVHYLPKEFLLQILIYQN